MKGKYRVIFHVDANSYYASVEMAHDPLLKDKPLAIAGNPSERKGIVITCNYIAREQGVYTTMHVREAKRKCPNLIVLPPNFDLYRETSQKMFAYLKTYTPLVEPVSIDECYLDVTNSLSEENPVTFAKRMQQGLLETLDVPVSIGIAPNKFLAKTASDMKKPLGITVLRKREIKETLWPLPSEDMHGVGEKTAKKLKEINILTIGDLAQKPKQTVQHLLGVNGIKLHERANGIDEREVDPTAHLTFKTIGNSRTLSHNTSEERLILDILLKLSQSVSQRMKEKKVVTQTIQITLRYSDFKTVTRSQKQLNPTNEPSELFSVAASLFRTHWNGNQLRLIGVTSLDVFDQSQAFYQLNLFTFENDTHSLTQSE